MMHFKVSYTFLWDLIIKLLTDKNLLRYYKQVHPLKPNIKLKLTEFFSPVLLNKTFQWFLISSQGQKWGYQYTVIVSFPNGHCFVLIWFTLLCRLQQATKKGGEGQAYVFSAANQFSPKPEFKEKKKTVWQNIMGAHYQCWGRSQQSLERWHVVKSF